jgi:serine phosphatase RsbU (regulator of sigma subunit)
VLPRADRTILIVIGDASGKGLQAGTLAVGALRFIADEDIGPAETIKRLNNVLLRTPNRGFITCLCINLASSGQMVLANAGHLSPYLDGTEISTLPGLPLGLVPGIEYEETSLVPPASARLTLMSDGVVEARSPSGELYGFDRTLGISRLSANEIAAEAKRFGQEDDITVITLDWRSQAMAII